MDIWNSTVQSLGGVCSWSSARAFLAAGVAWACSALSAVFTLAHPSIPFLIALVSVDFVLAAGIAWRENSFTWGGFRHGLGKFVAYALIFIVTSLADSGMDISGWAVNLTVAVSCYSITGEALSCLRHIDYLFPGRLPVWLIKRLETIRRGIERDMSGKRRRRGDWRGDSMPTASPDGDEKND
jgi:hypothetical protein